MIYRAPAIDDAWLTEGVLAVREECATDLAALGRARAKATAIAERWAADRPLLRLWFAAALARDEARTITANRWWSTPAATCSADPGRVTGSGSTVGA